MLYRWQCARMLLQHYISLGLPSSCLRSFCWFALLVCSSIGSTLNFSLPLRQINLCSWTFTWNFFPGFLFEFESIFFWSFRIYTLDYSLWSKIKTVSEYPWFPLFLRVGTKLTLDITGSSSQPIFVLVLTLLMVLIIEFFLEISQ